MLARALADNGYSTWHVGKWHLGGDGYGPRDHGFDINIGGCHVGSPGQGGYFSPWSIPVLQNVNVPDGTYLTDYLTPQAIALTSAGHDLKPMFADYYVYLGRNVPHIPYVTVTTPELADEAAKVAAACDCHGIVLRNHGAITLGTSIKEAYFRTLAIEEQTTIQHAALQVGRPVFLSDEECAELDKLSSESYRRELLARMRFAGNGTNGSNQNGSGCSPSRPP